MTSTPPPINGSRGGSFNLGDYINVSPSPAAAGTGPGSALPVGSMMQGRRLFDESDSAARHACPCRRVSPRADQAKAELERVRETLKVKQAEVKRLGTELAKIRAVPTDAEIEVQLADVQLQIDLAENALEPLRAGCQAPVSEADLAKLDAEWMRWRNEWVARRKVFKTIWEMRTDTMNKEESERLMEDLGIELDTPEHLELERSALCTKPGRPSKSTTTKRR
ncbi:hypothetical protein FRC09_014880 [Ceratobasidium sp. 395]|nr:hypothetical protein FRC09_014880 [Ceratobasidium sp. 395]